jgi:hypothetical protein
MYKIILRSYDENNLKKLETICAHLILFQFTVEKHKSLMVTTIPFNRHRKYRKQFLDYCTFYIVLIKLYRNTIVKCSSAFMSINTENVEKIVRLTVTHFKL